MASSSGDATGTEDGKVSGFNATTYAPLAPYLKSHKRPICKLLAVRCTDIELLISGSKDGQICVWRTEPNHPQEALRIWRHQTRVISGLVAHGSLLYVASLDGSTVVYDLDQLSPIGELARNDLRTSGIIPIKEIAIVVSSSSWEGAKLIAADKKGNLVDWNISQSAIRQGRKLQAIEPGTPIVNSWVNGSVGEQTRLSSGLEVLHLPHTILQQTRREPTCLRVFDGCLVMLADKLGSVAAYNILQSYQLFESAEVHQEAISDIALTPYVCSMHTVRRPCLIAYENP